MIELSRSTGIVTANGIPTGVPPVGLVSGFDIITKTALTVSTVAIHDGANSNIVLATGSSNAESVGFATTIPLNVPVKWDYGMWIELTAANAVVRYV